MERFEKNLERTAVVEDEKSSEDRAKGQKVDEPDLLPEFYHYKDEGCELAESCLCCPFPSCVYDRPWGRLKRVKGLRDKEIARLHIEEKMSIPDLIRQFDVSLRTVRRALAIARKKRGKRLSRAAADTGPLKGKEKRKRRRNERNEHSQPDSRKR